MIEFRMPALGADMDAAILVEWLKHPGDPVNRGDIIAVVETQKGAIEIEVFNDGVFVEARVQAGENVPVGDVMAILETPKEQALALSDDIDTMSYDVPPVIQNKPSPKRTTPSARQPLGLKITPVARKRAETLRLNVGDLVPDAQGVIGLKEVEAAALASVPGPAKRPGLDLEEMRKAIAAAMARSKREIPHYYVSSDFDVSTMINWLTRENARRTVTERLLYAAPLLKGLALALREAPEFNGFYENDQWVVAERINIGVAVSLRGGGLIAPAIRDVDMLGVEEIMAKLSDLVARVRRGRLRSSEMTDAGITLSNLGERTAKLLHPVIYPPQVAIVGCGQIEERPRVRDGAIIIGNVMTVSVAGDHRVSDGRRAARFLTNFENLLQNPRDL